MATIILTSESQQDLKKILQLAKKLGIATRELAKEEVEDISLSIAIKKGKTGEHVDTDDFLKELDNAS